MNVLKPRKKPVQGRSRATVEAILEGTVRVLVEGDFDGLTTTRVAEVAGVGVGTLYQYFPAKEALVFALLEREMRALEEAIVSAAAGVAGAPLTTQVETVIDALLLHKARRAELSSILRANMPRVDGTRLVRATVARVNRAVRAMLEPHLPGAPEEDVELMAVLVTTSVQGAVDAALELSPAMLKKRAFRDALVRLVIGYLRESGLRR